MTEIETSFSNDIMIVDDTPANLQLLSEILLRANYKVRPASNGELALRSAFARPPSLFLLDVRMPGMDGLELCRRIKADDRIRSVPVIFISALGEKNDKIDGFRVGGVDYITKPFYAEEVLARVNTHISLRRTQLDLERRNAEYAAAEIALKEATEREMAFAATIQRTLLLGEPPTRFPGVDLAFVTHPSQEIDGDFYDLFRISENVFDLLIADVMGKGVPAAFIGAATKAAFQRTVERETAWPGKSPASPNLIVDGVARLIAAQIEQLASYVTLIYARIDLIAHTVSIINCGHPPMLHGRHASKEIVEIKTSNPALGMIPQTSFGQETFSIAAGDMLLCYSDGVTDARNASRQFFGYERFISALKQNAWDHPADILASVEKEVRTFAGQERFSDDFTMIAVRFDDLLV
ncbi:MAG: SpoIIE family protein phosphatase [Candidatus Riflebacteria bacterium]|nr:SpoIIE family protein phosphatase [Candidatus Riflebacteria bacterium]